MIILDDFSANELRQQYIQSFVDVESEYYINNIKVKRQFVDGCCYVGYLWDCFKSPQVVSEIDLLQEIRERTNIFVMWDIHSCERILIPNYWKYPKSSILLLRKWSDEICSSLPEDIYLFDNTFTWSAVFTHEEDLQGNRYCLYLR